MSGMSRRGLLGLMAAAPVAAVAKPARAASKTTLKLQPLDFERTRKLIQDINSHIGDLLPLKGERVDIWTPCEDRLPYSRAADEGPGAPATKASGGVPTTEASALQAGAPAPESSDDHPILKAARAC